MGKKSKRASKMNKGKAKQKPVFTDGDFKRILRCMGEHDYNIALAHEDELVSHAERDLQTSGVECFLKLAAVFSYSGDCEKTEHYLDRVMWINDNMEAMISLEQVVAVILTYLRISKKPAAITVYCNYLKGQLLVTIAQVNEVVKGFMRAPKEEDSLLAYELFILEDHLAVAEKSTDWNENHIFYELLTSIYEDLNEYIKLRECLEIQLRNTRNMGNEESECTIMIEICVVYYKMAEFDKVLNVLDECSELLKKIKVGIGITGTHLKMSALVDLKLSALFYRGSSIRKRSIVTNGVLLPSDAEEVLEMYSKAHELATDVSDIIEYIPIVEEIASTHLEMGEFDLALKHAYRSKELYHEYHQFNRTKMENAMSRIFGVHLLLGQIYLNMFYCQTAYDKFYGQILYDGTRRPIHRTAPELESSMYHIERGADIWHNKFTCAQVHYCRYENSLAYEYLEQFLDASIAVDPLTRVTCGGCQQCNRMGNEMKQCSGCKTVCYCSTRCQKLQWKTGISVIGVSSIPHKVLCPLISYWRKKCKKEMKETLKGENGDDRLENYEERLTESCRSKFDQFFESLLQRGQAQARKQREVRARVKEQKRGHGNEYEPESEPEVNSLETSYEHLNGLD